jgi:tetrapyrrole methylase family protein / MazG family protein
VPLTIVGLGPAGLDRLGAAARAALEDPGRVVVLRTLDHPAAAALAGGRQVIACDDLYDTAGDFDEVYTGIAERVIALSASGRVVYGVPGSALVGERSVTLVRAAAVERGMEVVIHAGESFLDLLYERVGVDPIADGVQILDGRALPDPLPLHLPTVITQVDRPVVLGDVAALLGRVLPDDTMVTVLEDLGGATESVRTLELSGVKAVTPGPRTSLYLDPPDAGWYGLVRTNRRLRAECPWDRRQTHHTLVSHLVEEAYETIDALAALGDEAPAGEVDFGAYAEVEEELGDLLLQVVFHATLAAEAGAFDVEEVAEGIRRKLVRRHPHVFGDVEVSGADEVIANWQRLKEGEKRRESLMDGIPGALPGISRADLLQKRAASVGFDWSEIGPVVEKVEEELGELRTVLADPGRAGDELGDVLFAVVNLARHLEVDAELSLRRANERFARRFREVERMAAEAGRAPADMTLQELDALWDAAKRAEGAG